MNLKTLSIFCLTSTLFYFSASAQISINSGTTSYSYSQDFNSLATNGSNVTWANNSTVAGWSLFNKTPTAITTYNPDAGGGNGGFYSYGSSGAVDRALGGVGSGGAYFGNPSTGTVAGWIAAAFSNNSGGSASSVSISYDGEQWRNGGNTSAQTMVLQYGFGSTFTGVSSWTAAGSAFNFASPIATSTAGALDGNNSANRSAGRGGTLSGLSWANGSTLWLRWIENNDAGNDHGLAIDNFSFSTSFLQAAANYGWTGGGGTWQNGQNGSFGTSFNNAADSSVTFSGSSGTVSVSGSVQAGTLTFATGGYELNSGSLTVAQGSITTDTGTTTINSALEGAGGLTKAGAGALILNGANTVTGAVTITAGTLQIGSDGALGNAANDVANNGTLKTTSSLSLGAGRDLSGTGTLDIASGTTLTVNGNVNNTSTTLANSGTLDLQGSTRSVGNLTVNAAGTVNGSGDINATSLTASGLSSGTASINSGIVFTSGDKTLNVANGGTLDLNGALSNGGGTGRIVKTGTGTLILSAANDMGGLRIGSAASTMVDGGEVILENSVVGSQAQAIQHNFGTLRAATALTITNGISFGGRANGAATLAGSDMEFQGQSAFFRGGGTSGQLAVNANNTTTLSGGLGATSGGGTATGLDLGGTGTLKITGNSSTFTDTITTKDTVKLVVNSTLGAGVNVGSGTSLGGSGSVSALTVASGGVLSPGNSPGTLSAGDVTWAGGAKYVWEINNFLGTEGNNWDFLNATGTLTINATSGSKFLVDIVSLLASNNTAGGASNFDLYSNYSFAIATAAGGISYGDAGAFSADRFLLNTAGFANAMTDANTITTGSWAIGQSGNSLVLNYTAATAIPEPGSGSLLVIGLGMIAALRRRHLFR
jgi:autotransporter-associated beta strand protein